MLVRQELELAKAEITAKAKLVGIGVGMLSASAMAGLLALGSLTALAIVTLALVLPAWAAVLFVTVLWAAATVALALLGKRKVRDAGPLVPEQTIENIREDMAWARRGAKPKPPRA